MGTHHNRLDAKGRVSIPAPFRAALRGDNPQVGAIPLILRPSHFHACIEGWPMPVLQAAAVPLEAMDAFDPARDDLAATLYNDVYPVDPDREGRIVLPSDLVEFAGLGDIVVFMGRGDIFQIWEPKAAERRRDEMRQRARERAQSARAGHPSQQTSPQQTLGTPAA